MLGIIRLHRTTGKTSDLINLSGQADTETFSAKQHVSACCIMSNTLRIKSETPEQMKGIFSITQTL